MCDVNNLEKSDSYNYFNYLKYFYQEELRKELGEDYDEN